jgi:hypothetical protein
MLYQLFLESPVFSDGHDGVPESLRRQDYEMALYELTEVFPAFLEHAPRKAARALVAVMEAYVTHYHS